MRRPLLIFSVIAAASLLIAVPLVLRAQNDPVAALRATLASDRTIEATVSSGGASGTLTVAPDGSVLIVSGPERLIHNREADWELDAAARIYDRLPPAGPLKGGRVGTGRLHERTAALAVPFLVARGTGNLLKGPFTRSDREYRSDLQGATLTLRFDDQKRLTFAGIASMEGNSSWTIGNFRTVPTNPALFQTGIPTGYTEALEPNIPDALRAGTLLPPRFLARAPKEEGTWVLAILERGVAPSEGARGWLTSRLAKRFPVAIVDDASEADRRDLVAPDSPTLFLVRDGKVLGVWAGYAPNEERRMEDEMAKTPGAVAGGAIPNVATSNGAVSKPAGDSRNSA